KLRGVANPGTQQRKWSLKQRRTTTRIDNMLQRPIRSCRYVGALVTTLASVMLLMPGGARATPPNVVLITLDTTRADRMGFLGCNLGLTPNLDTLAKQSVIFARAYAHVPLTTASHATILTGTYPQYNGINDFGKALVPELPYLPHLLP